jgi:hypothetical protein
MNHHDDSTPLSEVLSELAAWAVGGGIITTVLFPLALPFIALLAIAALPLLIPVLAVAVVAAVVAVPVLLLRAVGMLVLRAVRSVSPAEHKAVHGAS